MTSSNEPKVVVKAPKALAAEDLDEFERLARKSGEVEAAGLKNRIKGAYLLGLVRLGGKIVAIGAIKNPSQTYRAGLQRKSNYSPLSRYKEELGYVFVEEEYRGKQLGNLVTRSLLAKCRRPVYATTKTDNVRMQKILKSFGFKKVGKSWPSGRRKSVQIMLWVRAYPLRSCASIGRFRRG